MLFLRLVVSEILHLCGFMNVGVYRTVYVTFCDIRSKLRPAILRYTFAVNLEKFLCIFQGESTAFGMRIKRYYHLRYVPLCLDTIGLMI